MGETFTDRMPIDLPATLTSISTVVSLSTAGNETLDRLMPDLQGLRDGLGALRHRRQPQPVRRCGRIEAMMGCHRRPSRLTKKRPGIHIQQLIVFVQVAQLNRLRGLEPKAVVKEPASSRVDNRDGISSDVQQSWREIRWSFDTRVPCPLPRCAEGSPPPRGNRFSNVVSLILM